ASDAARVERLGEAGRRRVLAGFTDRHVVEAVAALYREMGTD
ncbi:MAG: glycosyltransferase family 1 protein, partial [Hyphomicrobiales bacterium]|nr:glycosyltransferase family 1 protein [Hyphomicrobiales bacterium]